MKKLFTLLLLFSVFVTAYTQSPGTWESKGSGITVTNRQIVGTSVVDSNTIWGITLNPSFNAPFREFTRTTDGGNTWKSGVIDSANTLNTFFNLGIFAFDEKTVWVIMGNLGQQNIGGIYKTSDGGQTWVQQTGSFSQNGNAITAIHFFDANNGVTFGSPGTGNQSIDSLRIWTTANGGDTWNRIPPTQLPVALPAEGVWINLFNGTYEAQGDTIWFGTRRGRIWRSTNKGTTWEAFTLSKEINIFNAAISTAFKDAQNGIAVGDGPDQGFRTQDGGVNWEPLSLPTSIAYYQIEYVPGTEGGYFLSYEASSTFGNDRQHAYTLNNGDSWILIENPGIECFEFVSSTTAWGGGRVISSTQGGMYKWTGNFATTTATKEAADITHQIKFSPNPFTDHALLEFELKDNTLPVEITVTDILGRTIKSYSLDKPNAGMNQIPLNLDAPAGLLFLTLRQGDGVKTLKMIKQ